MKEKREQTHQQQIKEENPSKQAQPIQEDNSSEPMKEKDGVKQVHQNEQIKETTDARDEDKQEDRVIPMLEENQLLDGRKEEKDRNGEEVNVENQVLKSEKVGDSQIDLAEKPKRGSKQSLKTKPTIPQPFSLSNARRMSKVKRGSIDFSSENMKQKPKERHGSTDYKNPYSQPRLSRSVSLSHKDQFSPSAREISDLKRAKWIRGTSKTSSMPQVTAADQHVENRIEKQRVEEMESSNLQKSSTFKALPLPRFYQKKDFPPSKSETKKMPGINSKSPLLGQQNFPGSMSKAENNKLEDKGKGPSKRITNGTKETITKLLKSTRKVLNTSKVTPKGIASGA